MYACAHTHKTRTRTHAHTHTHTAPGTSENEGGDMGDTAQVRDIKLVITKAN